MTQSLTPYGEVVPAPIRSRTMENAVTLMYCGAGLSVLTILVTVAFRSRLEQQLLSGPAVTGGSPELVSDVIGLFVAAVVVGNLFCTCLWIWMAISNGRGRPWARLTATGLAGIGALSYLSTWAVAVGSTGINGDAALANLVVGLLGQVVAWSTVYYLWHRESAPVYAAPRY